MEKNQTQKKKPNYIPALILIIGVVVAAAVCGYYSMQEVETVIQGQVEVSEYRVSSKVPGRVLRVLVEEGQQVKAGEVVAVLEAPEINAKLSQAESAEDAAAALLRKAERGAREEQIRAAYEMWQKAIAGREVMQKSYDRVKNLYDEGVTTAQKLDEVTAQRDAAIATENAAKSQYEMAKNGALQEDKDAARAQQNRAAGAVAEVNSYLKETTLVALEDGEVTDIFPHVGELVGTGAPVMNVALMDKMWLTFNVREDQLAKFKVGNTIEVTIPALGDKVVKAKVMSMKDLGSYAAWKATKTTGQYDMKTFSVKCVPLKKFDGLKPGMSAIVKN